LELLAIGMDPMSGVLDVIMRLSGRSSTYVLALEDRRCHHCMHLPGTDLSTSCAHTTPAYQRRIRGCLGRFVGGTPA
jgi:hypothetical protein